MAKKDDKVTKSPKKEKAKGLKLDIKNKQIAKAVNLKSIKDKLSKKKAPEKEHQPKKGKDEGPPEEEAPRIKARSKSAFARKEGEKESTPSKDVVAHEEAQTIDKPEATTEPPPQAIKETLGPTGKHIKDLLPAKKKKEPKKQEEKAEEIALPSPTDKTKEAKEETKAKEKKPSGKDLDDNDEDKKQRGASKKGAKGSKFREFRDMKSRSAGSWNKQGGRGLDDGPVRYRKKKTKPAKIEMEEKTIRPTSLTIRIPISVKELASEMKLKASEVIGQLFQHGVVATINDYLDDETTIQILGDDLGCQIQVDTSEEERIRITDKTIQEEISESEEDQLKPRAPIVTFMGHVDHGKTSLIDKIRKSNIVAGESGAITQHIGAFKVKTAVGEIAILDTPGHEAFSAMRSRGANVTDIVVLVVAGDEGIRQQTIEAIKHALDANVTIVVAINKSDKPNFDANNIYRDLSEQNLLPEAWGGQIITVNCSAVTGEGIPELLEMLSLQSEVLELKANPHTRARGSVIESEMHKGLGSVVNILIQNGTLRSGDAFVIDCFWGRVKTMRDEHGVHLTEAGPSTPVEITGLSGLPEAGEEIIVVSSEKEARNIAQTRSNSQKQSALKKKALSLDSILEDVKEIVVKVFTLIVCADVQGSLEALVQALNKIKSEKVELNIISENIGEVSESIIQLASASNATILGFHTQVESHAEPLIKQLGVKVLLHDVIYHAIDDIKELMQKTLDKIPEENDRGVALVRQIFKSSHLGIIAGCFVTDGTIHRNHHVRIKRDNEIVWTGKISSLKRVKEDVKEVQKGVECGILLHGFSDIQPEDIIESYEILYREQEL